MILIINNEFTGYKDKQGVPIFVGDRLEFKHLIFGNNIQVNILIYSVIKDNRTGDYIAVGKNQKKYLSEIAKQVEKIAD